MYKKKVFVFRKKYSFFSYKIRAGGEIIPCYIC
jgi:hypothetical protein